jgi:hypothetical protein
MPIDCTHSDQFCGFFKFAAGGLIAGYPEHGVPLRQLLGVQLASFSKQVDISGTEVILHIASAICLATLINELAVNAAKRGALSLSTGKVSLQWFIDEQSDPATPPLSVGGNRRADRCLAKAGWVQPSEH